jgi:hypothetical protein
VTRLGEFSPIGCFFSLGSFFFKITEVSQIYGLFFPNVLVIYLFLRNTGFGDSFGDFFTNASGHPG